MRKIAFLATLIASLFVAGTAMAQAGGAWNGPRGSGYWYNNNYANNNNFWNNGGGAMIGGLAGGLLGSMMNRQQQVVAVPMAPVVVMAQPQVTQAPMWTNQPNTYVAVAPPTPVGPTTVMVPQGTYVTNQPIAQSAEFPDPATGLMCRLFPQNVGGIIRQGKLCQMPSGQWATVR